MVPDWWAQRCRDGAKGQEGCEPHWRDEVKDEQQLGNVVRLHQPSQSELTKQRAGSGGFVAVSFTSSKFHVCGYTNQCIEFIYMYKFTHIRVCVRAYAPVEQVC